MEYGINYFAPHTKLIISQTPPRAAFCEGVARTKALCTDFKSVERIQKRHRTGNNYIRVCAPACNPYTIFFYTDAHLTLCISSACDGFDNV
ncbi:MAG: hypothetical protein CM1200mP30_29670 [Pseudomonadota bacterium]|nr:MAG: hypothetical protein CM1200mP30_29670 [Pseudomonadota bacterium]